MRDDRTHAFRLEPDTDDVERMGRIITLMSEYGLNQGIPSWVAESLAVIPYVDDCMVDFLMDGDGCGTLHVIEDLISGLITRMHDDGEEGIGAKVLDSLFDAVGRPSDGRLPEPYTVDGRELTSIVFTDIPYGPDRIVGDLMDARREAFEREERSRLSDMGIYGDDLDIMIRFSRNMGEWAGYLRPEGHGSIVIDEGNVDQAVHAGALTIDDIGDVVLDRLVRDAAMDSSMAYVGTDRPSKGRRAVKSELSKSMSVYVMRGDVDGMVFIRELSSLLKEAGRVGQVDVPIGSMTPGLMGMLFRDLIEASPEFAREDVIHAI